MNYEKSIQLTDWIGEKYILMGAEPGVHLKIRGRMRIRLRFWWYNRQNFPFKKAAVIAACLALSLTVVFAVVNYPFPYKRISFDSQTLGENLEQYIDEDTLVENAVSESFPAQFPVYKISPHKISNEEFQHMITQLELEKYAGFISLSGNTISGMIKPIPDTAFNMTDKELEKLAWETFNKLPFMEGSYKYCGITGNYTLSDSTGTHITRVGVSFRRTLDDIRILGADRCELYFDSTGLAEIYISLYDYKNIDEMDLVPLESAASRIKNPDSFSIDTGDSAQRLGIIDTLRVEKCELVYYNQYYRECTILQPVYNFTGTATDANGVQAKFRSIVIAIPDSYTYESE